MAEDKEYTFLDVLKLKWKTAPMYMGRGVYLSRGLAIFQMVSLWKKERPLLHQMRDQEAIKLMNVLTMAKQMYLHLEKKQGEDDCAKKIIEAIHSGKILKTDDI